MTVYTTKQDAIDHLILPTLGEWSDDFDLDQIFDATFTYSRSLGGFVLFVTEAEFWSAVADADLTA